MATFVDPRSNPAPGFLVPLRALAESIEEIAPLHQLCREGRLYEVEAWISAGRPLQLRSEAIPKSRRIDTALEIALETGQYALILLLRCNGYRLDHEPVPPLTRALEARHWRFVDLLWAWGADPLQVSPYTIFDTYRSDLFERFYAAGVDFLVGHALGDALVHPTSNKPLFGFAKRHLATEPRFQAELNIAVRQHAYEGNVKGVLLSLWAGADPHAPAPDLDSPEDEELCETAIEAAVLRGHANLLSRLKPDPARDNFEELFQTAPDGATVDALAALAPPRSMGTILARQAFHLASRWPFEESTRAHQCAGALKHLFQAGGRWTESPPEEIRTIRQDLLRASDSIFTEVMKLLTFDEYCSPAVLQELTRTPSMRQRMTKVGLLPSVREEKVGGYTIPHRIRGDPNIIRKLGIVTPKEKKPLPSVVHVGQHHYGGQTIRLDRRGLYERVWSEPVEAIAKAWGLSGRGLAKVCKRLRIPVPPRGYWAEAQHGRRPARVPLRDLPGGEAVEIVIHASGLSA